ncbi:hypothetical protein GJ744_005691 [Endocarpon pusillum]|uniref:Cysteine-rich PDZ-binding protein n=1 Tax=Endocarpon pusillum TaxID=364733 RepID=A0A8H7APU0_9EURO|nr:hypothetical protein GJ744_005691 [Endocarpon pusillum]
MVCSKCQKVLKKTELATPGVKRKNDIYLGSPTAEKSSAPSNGVSKNKLLSKGAKNPYAAYSGSCETCKTKTERGRKYCQRCAYKKNACAMCGKSVGSQDGKGDEPVVQGQKFSAK